jgi:branched-chain amino acid transport system substrate-binding protein
VLGAVAAVLHVLAALSFAGSPPAPVIGLALPKSGAYADVGAALREGVALAMADKELSGARIPATSIIEEDDGCSGVAGAEAARRLIARAVDVVIGHPCASAAIAAAKLYADAGIPFIALANTHPRLTEARAGPQTFRLAGRSDREGAVAGLYLAEHFAGRRMALISDRSAYGQALVEGARRTLIANGIAGLVTGHLTPAEKDYTAVVEGLKGAGVSVVLFGGFATEATVLADNMRSIGLEAQLLLGEAAADEIVLKAAGAAVEGVMILAKPDPAAFGERAEAVLSRLKTSALPPAIAGVSAYAGIEVLDQALAHVRIAAPSDAPEGAGAERLAAILSTAGFDTVLGRVRFDAHGDAELPAFGVRIWRNGSLKQIWMPKPR